MNKKALAILAAVIGVALIIIAILYFITPAQSLPSFFPGYQAGLAKVHFKHGIGAFLLGLGCFAFAWFQSGKKKNKTESTTPTPTQ